MSKAACIQAPLLSEPSVEAHAAPTPPGGSRGPSPRGGDLPVNPHGGQLSEGRTHGYGFLYEAVTQLRHEAGQRQVAGARTAVVTSGGGTPSGVLLLQRDGT